MKTKFPSVMPKIVDPLTVKALSLPAAARALLAEELLESLDAEEDFSVSPAWRKEARRRVQEMDSGKVRGIPSAEVFRKARRIFK